MINPTPIEAPLVSTPEEDRVTIVWRKGPEGQPVVQMDAIRLVPGPDGAPGAIPLTHEYAVGLLLDAIKVIAISAMHRAQSGLQVARG